MTSPRTLVAMSGGVDSSVAAARLVAAGHEVVGVTLHLWDYPDDGSVKSRCCAPEDVHDARRVADQLGIDHFSFDRRQLFQDTVVAPFVEAYLRGETPSPCVHCNRGVKAAELFHLADRLDAEFVATGHYARVSELQGTPRLFRGHDNNKDQSYFLFSLDESQLRRVRFPLGCADKATVRAEALERGLVGAEKGESQELCFVPTGHYSEFVSARAAERVRPGPILSETGERVGMHQGTHQFTIGQRRNLGVSVGERTFVVGIDAERGSVQLGPRSQLLSSAAILKDVVLAPTVQLPLAGKAQVRYRGRPHQACWELAPDGDHRVSFETPVEAVVPGQVLVLYEEDLVLGGGTIASAESAERS